jgi:predicted phage tail protein
MDRWMARVTAGAVTLVIALLALMVAFGFFGVTVFLELRTVISPPLAALATGGAALILAGIISLIGRMVASDRGSASQDGRNSGGSELNKLAADLGEILGKEAISAIRANPRSTALVSLFSGFALAAFPELRRVIVGLIDKGDRK